jgi:hypothetical protein
MKMGAVQYEFYGSSHVDLGAVRVNWSIRLRKQ